MSDDFELKAGTRAGLRSNGAWRKDGWFISWSPRNDNHFAEGPWKDWVGLAKMILAHDAEHCGLPVEDQVNAEKICPETKPPLSDDETIERMKLAIMDVRKDAIYDGEALTKAKEIFAAIRAYEASKGE